MTLLELLSLHRRTILFTAFHAREHNFLTAPDIPDGSNAASTALPGVFHRQPPTRNAHVGCAHSLPLITKVLSVRRSERRKVTIFMLNYFLKGARCAHFQGWPFQIVEPRSAIYSGNERMPGHEQLSLPLLIRAGANPSAMRWEQLVTEAARFIPTGFIQEKCAS